MLLLTQGWRRYAWSEENLKRNIFPQIPVIADGTSGEVHYTKKLKQAPKGRPLITIFNPAENNTKMLTVPDVDGKFTITPEHLKIWQGAYIYIKPMGQEDFVPRITLDRPFENIEDVMKQKIISYPIHKTGDTIKENKSRPFMIPTNVKFIIH